MAYAVETAEIAPGITTYRLGGTESFVVLAASWQVSTNNGGTPAYWFDYRDANGGIIALQCVGRVDSDQPTLVSLAPPNPPAATIDGSGVYLFPKIPTEANNVLVSPIMAGVPLEPGCTINAYVASPDNASPSPDPMDTLDTGADPHDLHLWVEDMNQLGRNLPDVSNPLLLGVGSG